jgi:transposase InsO family protein
MVSLTLGKLGSDSLKEVAASIGLSVDNANKEELREKLLAAAKEHGWTEQELMLGGAQTKAVPAEGSATNNNSDNTTASGRSGNALDMLRSSAPYPAAGAVAVNPLPLTPPGPFNMAPNGRPRRWEDFKRLFHIFLRAMGQVDADRRVGLFLHAAGAEFVDFVAALTIPQPAEGHDPLDVLLEIVTTKFCPVDSVIFECSRLEQIVQAPGELIDDYALRLRVQAKRCKFKCSQCSKDEEDFRILQVLARNSNNDRLRHRIFERGLTQLEQVLALGRGMEVADSRSREVANAGKSPATHTALFVGQRNRRGPEGGKAPPDGSWKDKKKKGARPRKDAKAESEQRSCYGCGKKGHIKRDCGEATRYVSSAQDNGEYALFNVGGKKQVFGHILLDGRQREVQLDTGSSCNVIPASFVSKGKLRRMQKAPALRTFGAGQAVLPLGALALTVGLPGEELVGKRRFVVVGDADGPALLGLHLCVELGFISLNADKVYKCVELPENKPRVDADSKVESPEMQALLAEYADVFGSDLGGVKGVKARVTLKADARPRFMRARHVPLALAPKVKAEIADMVSRGTFKAVKTAEHASPMVTVAKPNGAIRLCADYTQTLAGFFDVEAYPLPRPEDLFGQMSGGKFYSKLDLRTCYEQFELDEDSKKILTVNTISGLMEYQRLPYGIASAPAIVQRAMEEILAGLNVLVFLDDLMVRSSSYDEHIALLRQVLDRLRVAGIRLKNSKCEWAREEVSYLGFRISSQGRKVDPERVRAIVEMPEPKDVIGLRSYLGMVVFYARFIQDMAALAEPLHRLLRKDEDWRWGPEEEAAFRAVNAALSSAPTLTHFDPQRTLVVSADAGPAGLGAVLAHRDDEDREWPIAFASRSLSKAEQNYSQIDKEATALMFGLKKFETFLWGRAFILVTDHRPLVAILGPKKAFPALVTARLHRYAVKLLGFQYVVEFRKGSKHGNADALSRAPLERGEEDTEWINVIATPDAVGPVTWLEIKRMTEEDEALRALRDHARAGFPDEAPSEALKPYWRHRNAYAVEDDVLCMAGRVVLPANLRLNYLRQLHAMHQGTVRMKALARREVWWPGFDADVEDLSRDCATCQESAAHPAKVYENWPAEEVWARVHLDYAKWRGMDFLVVVDAGSKWIEALPMRSTTSAATLRALAGLFARFGLPTHVHVDGGPQFVSQEFRDAAARWNAQLTVSPPYHPPSNGIAERAVRTVKEMLGHVGADRLEEALFQYRATPQPGGQSPAELLMGRRLRTRLTLAPKKTESEARPPAAYRPGDRLRVRTFGRGPRWTLGTVERMRGRAVVEALTDDGAHVRRHLNQCRR